MEVWYRCFNEIVVDCILNDLNLPSDPEVHLDLERLAGQYLPKMRK